MPTPFSVRVLPLEFHPEIFRMTALPSLLLRLNPPFVVVERLQRTLLQLSIYCCSIIETDFNVRTGTYNLTIDFSLSTARQQFWLKSYSFVEWDSVVRADDLKDCAS